MGWLLTYVCLWSAIAPPESSYEDDVGALDQAYANLGVDEVELDASLAAVRQAIDAVERHPDQVPNDAKVLDQLAEARLGLVWQLLEVDDTEAAVDAMDEAIRSARGRSLPAGNFGPEVLALYEKRSKVLKERGSAVIEVDCGAIPCQMVVAERRSANPTDPLFVGTYRVWVGARDGEPRWEYFEVSLDEAGTHETLTYAAGQVTDPAPGSPTRAERAPLGPTPQDDQGDDRPGAKKRVMPRWAEATLIGVGVSALIAGSVLLGFDGKCGGYDPAYVDNCSRYHEYSALGLSLVGVGAGSLLLGGVTLGVDEVRGGRGRRSARVSIGWSIRF